jgi:hypothetical protein
MTRTIRAAQLQLANWPSVLGWIWAISATAFAVNVAIWAAMPDDARVQAQTGGLVTLHIMVYITFVQMMTQYFPLAAGLGVTRRRFAAATALVATGLSLAFGAILLVLERVETATGGWGLSLEFFAMPLVAVDHPVGQFGAYVVSLLAFAAVGAASGVMHVRWGAKGVNATLLGALLVVGTVVVVLTRTDGWGALADWFTARTWWEVASLWLALAVAAGAAGWTALRRTPV